ncbi:glycerophosphodiester phosphodiesterase [Kytococcus sedentarius]|uniref:glycerophosphodiester phosphodiesterase n=1 Tax=Kytococcus sedentarius TaxID=1276 RepID=UPI0035BC122F
MDNSPRIAASLLLTATGLGLVAAAPAAATGEEGASRAPTAHPVFSAEKPWVIGHRGASGHRPEHTLEAYELAVRMGADFFEPDLVSTKDGVLVCRHENEISGTTDVADRPEFAERRTTRTVDGVELTGWFTEDFTLAELKTLRAIERIPAERPDNTRYDGQFEVATFAEVLELRERLSAETGREIGIIPEIKHPTYFDGLGLSMEEPLVEQLRGAGLDHADAPVHVQSFELQNLVDLNRDLGARVPLVFLSSAQGRPWDLEVAGDPRTYADLMQPAGLDELARDVDAIGPDRTLVVPEEGGVLGEPTSLVADAHAAGLAVTPYTFRAENAFLPESLRSSQDPAELGDMDTLVRAHLDAGVDGVFADQPGMARQTRDAWREEDGPIVDTGVSAPGATVQDLAPGLLGGVGAVAAGALLVRRGARRA